MEKEGEKWQRKKDSASYLCMISWSTGGAFRKKRPRKSLACPSAAFSGILNSFGTFCGADPAFGDSL